MALIIVARILFTTTGTAPAACSRPEIQFSPGVLAVDFKAFDCKTQNGPGVSRRNWVRAARSNIKMDGIPAYISSSQVGWVLFVNWCLIVRATAILAAQTSY